MDQHKLRSLVFDKTGVKIDVDDPVFALVALNEAVLEEAVERHIALLDAASRELAEQIRAAGGLPPALPVQPALNAAAAVAPSTAAGPAAPTAPLDRRLLLATAGISLLTALLVCGLQALFSKPPALTPQQTAALAHADKLARAIEHLDPKTRSDIQTALSK